MVNNYLSPKKYQYYLVNVSIKKLSVKDNINKNEYYYKSMQTKDQINKIYINKKFSNVNIFKTARDI